VNKPRMLLDPYLSWAEKEGVPITEDFGVDLLKVPTAHWPRMGVEGGIVHLKGRGDFGELVYAGMDWVEPALARRSMQLMAEQVMPRVNAAIAKTAPARAAAR